MKFNNGPTVSYGQFDEPKSIKKVIFQGLTIFGICGTAIFLGFNGSTHLEHAAIGKATDAKKVRVEQKQGESTTITQENRKWLDNVVSEVK